MLSLSPENNSPEIDVNGSGRKYPEIAIIISNQADKQVLSVFFL